MAAVRPRRRGTLLTTAGGFLVAAVLVVGITGVHRPDGPRTTTRWDVVEGVGAVVGGLVVAGCGLLVLAGVLWRLLVVHRDLIARALDDD